MWESLKLCSCHQSLSDELGKNDTSIEMVIRKIERQYNDISSISTPGTAPTPLAIGSGNYLMRLNFF
jgi:hypothetical protein